MAVVKSIVTSNTDHLVSIETEIKGMRANELTRNKRVTAMVEHLSTITQTPR